MTCKNCGLDREQDFNFCPVCGATNQPDEVRQNPAAHAVLCALKDKLFLTICILMSASCILSLAADNLPLLSILTTVFLWLAFAKSRKDVADVSHLRCVSGTVYAQYVINNVLAVILLVVGIIFYAAFDMIAGEPGFWNAILADIGTEYTYMSSMIASVSGAVILVVFILLAAIILLINVFSIRYIHRFAKSVYQSVENGVLELKHTKATRIWLFVFGACTGIGALSSLASSDVLAGLGSGVSCATAIIAGLLIGKYLASEN